jgi:hypothetical protein
MAERGLGLLTRPSCVESNAGMLSSLHRSILLQDLTLPIKNICTSALRIPLLCAGTADAKFALTTNPQPADHFEAFELPARQNDEPCRTYSVAKSELRIMQKLIDETMILVLPTDLTLSGAVHFPDRPFAVRHREGRSRRYSSVLGATRG